MFEKETKPRPPNQPSSPDRLVWADVLTAELLEHRAIVNRLEVRLAYHLQILQDREASNEVRSRSAWEDTEIAEHFARAVRRDS